MKTLFIGGQEDGNWHDIPEERDYWKVPEKMEVPTYIGGPSVSKATFRVFLYKRERLLGKDYREHSVMMLNSDEDLIAMLISGYRQTTHQQ